MAMDKVVEGAVEGLTKNQKMMLNTKIGAVAISTLFIAGTSVLDAAKRRQESKMMDNEKKEQLREQQRKQRIESKAKRDVYDDIAKRNRGGYHRTDLGQTVIDLFNERQGHHKMGNSKF